MKKYKQPHNIKLKELNLNECEEHYLRYYLHHKGKYESKHLKSKRSRREK